MKTELLYDVFVSIDEKYVREAENTLSVEKTPIKEFSSNGIKRMKSLAAAVLLICLVFSLALMTGTALNNNHLLKKGYSPIKNGNAGVSFKAETISSSSIDASGGVCKEMPTGFSFITIPATVSNNSSFTMECAFGLDDEDWMFTDDKYYPELIEKGITLDDEFDFSVYVENRVFGLTSYLTASDIISFFDNGGYYKQYIGYDQLESEFKFNSGAVLSPDGTISFSNIVNSDSLPFHWTVPVRIDLLENGTKGLISAGFLSETKIGNNSYGNVSLIYYYCSGEYVGFGATEEEAFKNSFVYEESNNDIVGIASYSKIINEASITEHFYCDSYMYLFPIESNNSEFDKSQRVTFTFEVQNDWCNGQFDLMFESENIYEPSYIKFNNNKKEYCEISFRADPYKNGRIRVNICPMIKEEVDVIPHKSITLYTSNSHSKTYVSAASMETAMAMAGQEIDSGMICDCDIVIGEFDQTRAAPITVRGIVSFLYTGVNDNQQ